MTNHLNNDPSASMEGFCPSSPVNRLAGLFQGIVGSQSPGDRLGEHRERAELAAVGAAVDIDRGTGGAGGDGDVT